MGIMDVEQTGFIRDCEWGSLETLSIGRRYRVKRLKVKPGASFSFERHMHRAEHWIVVQGSAQTTIDGTRRLISENEWTYIPLGTVHKLENPGKLPLHLIEVQSGGYLEEDDNSVFDGDNSERFEAA